MLYLPSKKFIISVFLILFFGAGSFWLFENKSTENEPILGKGKNFVSEMFKNDQSDSDNDGLKDWEEALWKTDPNNHDTDGDGVADGKETAQNRNPLKSGPDDKMANFKIAASVSAEENNELTKTDILARDFFANFLALWESGNLNEESAGQLTESFLENINQQQLEDRYKISDLKIIGNEDKNSVKDYGNNLAEIIKKYYGLREENELTIINQALEAQDEIGLQKLNAIIELYNDASLELIKIEVPKSIAYEHLIISNSAWNIAQALKLTKNFFIDTVQGLIGLKQYQLESVRANNALENISSYFMKKEVYFHENEEGYIFVNSRQK